MGKQIDQIISKDWSKALWELNRILAKIQGGSSGDGVVTTTTATGTTIVQNIVGEADETLHWVL